MSMTDGSGAIAIVGLASSAIGPTVPSLLFFCRANSGNAAAIIVRIAALHLSAEAATDRYAFLSLARGDMFSNSEINVRP